MIPTIGHTGKGRTIETGKGLVVARGRGMGWAKWVKIVKIYKLPVIK
jgi:hypothetical protein